MFKTSSVFDDLITAYNTDKRFIIQQGGTRSGKTWSTLQLLFQIALRSDKQKIITVISKSLPNLKLGAIRDFEKILESYGIIPETIRNKTDNIYKVGKSIIEFFGADQTDKVHGPSRDILFINEANFIKYDIFVQLDQRTEQCVIIDYNPSVLFWVQEEILPHEDHILLKTTFEKNEFCPVKIKERLMLKLDRYYKEKAAGTITKAFENYCKVYLFGELGTLEGTIFENWRYENPGEIDEAYKSLAVGFGLDYGFHPDPDAMIKCAIDTRRKIMYLKECIYKSNNGTEELREQIGRYVNRNDLIVAESATPRTNYDLRKSYNIVPVKKTKSVSDWLRVLHDYELVISADSNNLAKELQNYVWSDKKAGIPIDEWNHLIDAFRYYAMFIIQPRPKMRKIT